MLSGCTTLFNSLDCGYNQLTNLAMSQLHRPYLSWTVRENALSTLDMFKGTLVSRSVGRMHKMHSQIVVWWTPALQRNGAADPHVPIRWPLPRSPTEICLTPRAFARVFRTVGACSQKTVPHVRAGEECVVLAQRRSDEPCYGSIPCPAL